jgi:hypothetical protein
VKWAKLKKKRAHAQVAYVSVYDIDDDILQKAYKVRYFDHATAEWLSFLIQNRNGIATEKYDLVMVLVANDTLYATLLLFEQGVLSVEATIEQLKTHHLFDQLSFHSDTELRELRFV